LDRKRYLWSVVVVALPDILPCWWRSRVLVRHGNLCSLLANYAADLGVLLLDLFLNTARNHVDVVADIQRKRKKV
jgi:hypothetical protein